MKLEKNSSFVYVSVMSKTFKDWLLGWKKAYLRDVDLQIFFHDQHQKRYDAVKYAIRHEFLKSIRRGLYLITFPHKAPEHEPFELAQVIYGPSYLSLESALSYHGWIPEAVYSTTSVTARRTKKFETVIGLYSYHHTPEKMFFQYVERVESAGYIFLIASPWKALADYIYVRKTDWDSLQALYNDLRIEEVDIQSSDLICLKALCKDYPSKRVQTVLKKLLKDIAR